MNDHLGKAIEELQNESNRKDEDGKVLKSLLLVKLLADLNIRTACLQPRWVEIILQSLVLNPDSEQKQCLQLDYLDKCFDTSTKE